MRKARISFAAVFSAYLLRVGKGFWSPENVYLEPFSSAKFAEIIPENSIMVSHFSHLCIGLYCFHWTSATSAVQMFMSFAWLQ